MKPGHVAAVPRRLYNNCCYVIFHWAPLNSPGTIIFRLVGPTRRLLWTVSWFVQPCPYAILAFDNTNSNVADHFFTFMCFESKTRASALVPCVLELHLELRRFISIRKCWNTKYREISVVIVPYIRDNSCMYVIMPYAVWNMPYSSTHPL